jgi:hypothetical protein
VTLKARIVNRLTNELSIGGRPVDERPTREK